MSDTIKYRPIIFTGESVRSILAGRKTQTRRVMNPQPERQPVQCHWCGTGWALEGLPNEYGIKGCSCRKINCRWYVGERLWVKETWRPSSHVPLGEKADYLADTPGATGEGFFKWKPSMFMPRWASRLTLEIVGVRVDRVQDITDTDAIAEGIEAEPTELLRWKNYSDDGPPFNFAFSAYSSLWDKINGEKYPWASNPYVWVIEFKRIES